MIKCLLTSLTQRSNGISALQIFSMSLSSKVSIGNIFMVTTGVLVGGAGVIFWIWVFGLLAMVIAFVEAILGQIYREKNKELGHIGGAAWYVKSAFRSKRISQLFAIISVIAFSMFGAFQASYIASLFSNFAVGYYDVAIIKIFLIIFLIMAIGIFVLFGIKSIAKVSPIITLIMMTLYLVVVCAIFINNYKELPGIINLIIIDAFSFEEVGNTLLGISVGIMLSIEQSVKRGMFFSGVGNGVVSNIASLGDETFSHPVIQAFLQSFAVFVDIIVICSTIGIIFILGGRVVVFYENLDIVYQFQQIVSNNLGTLFGEIITIVIILFSFSAIMTNYCYCEINIRYVLGSESRNILKYKIAYLILILVASFQSFMAIFYVIDFLLLCLAIINIVAIILLSKYIFAVFDDFERKKANNLPLNMDTKTIDDIIANNRKSNCK